ncbi:MAG: hypothetical protein AB7U27_09300, partial [Aminobacteriaceae bacterium]
RGGFPGFYLSFLEILTNSGDALYFTTTGLFPARQFYTPFKRVRECLGYLVKNNSDRQGTVFFPKGLIRAPKGGPVTYYSNPEVVCSENEFSPSNARYFFEAFIHPCGITDPIGGGIPGGASFS